ncbi:uncharacterized protein LOC117321184 [Pecten maximus]|uniref:uncharacterized protein LOC117321184 n=1 Tax=Pecten maximus TaxID=6579 RepID=UPI001458D9DA|nr:uncharacterized protein LOC117321184 [Pecten maximus]
MSSLISCVLENNTTDNTTDRAGCVDDLWHLLGTLQQEDFKGLMDEELGLICNESDTLCTRRRGLFVDMLSRRGDWLSQTLITTLILKSPITSEEEMQRCLFHLVALGKPSLDLMRAVEEVCMGEDDSFSEILSLSNTQRRSCLSLGALVKNAELQHASYAEQVIEKLEMWLNTKGRNIESSESDVKRNRYIVTKMALLHAIGNAGMNRSVKHITSFMKPNTGPPEWRRAAVSSLKHFTCNKSADSLLHTALHDDNRQVKEEAYEAFLSHPNKGKLTGTQKDDILSANYTYPTLLRLRRGVVTYSASLKDGLYFGIVLPGIHWQKVIGNSAIGAEFGITLRNNLELELKFLSGHFEIDVYNAAFAVLNLKLLNLRYSLLDAKMCYMGHVGYDMNILKKTIDAVTITLPYIGKKFVQSLKKIIAAVTSFLTSPIQSIASLAKGLLDVKLSIGMFMDFKNIMMETLMKITGKTPFWQSYGDELEDIFEEVKSFISMVTASAQVPSEPEDPDSTRLSDCVSSMVKQILWSKEELKAVLFDSVNDTFFSSDFGKDIFEKVKDVIDVYKSLKSSYTSLKSYVQKSISLVQRVFGPKFHKDFPTRRRRDTPECGQGVWPTTSNNAFETTGVDVTIASGRELVSPVNGRVYRESSSRILVIPTDDGLTDFEIIIENAEAVHTISYDGTFAEAGETVAMVLNSKCQPNFIHVSVRKANSTQYIDPTRFLDRIMPTPKWVLECKDLYLKHIFQTIDIDNLGESFKDLYEDIKRTVLEKIDELSQKAVDDISFEIQIETEGAYLEIDSSAGSVLETLKQSLPDFGNVMKLYSLKGITDGLNILKLVDMGSFTLEKINSMLGTDLGIKLDEMIIQLRMANVDISYQDPGILAISQLQSLFKDLQGDWHSTIHEALLRYEKDCPNFKGVVGKGVGLACTARANCSGLSCNVPLNIGSIRPVVKLDMSLDPCSALLYITDKSMTSAVTLDGEIHTVTLPDMTTVGPDSEPYVLTLTIQGEEENKAIYFSVEGALCVKCHTSCLQPFTIVSDARVDIPDICSNTHPESGTDDEILRMTWRQFLDSLSEIGALDNDTLKIADSIRKYILESMVEQSFSKEYTQAVRSAFPNAKDTCSVDEKSLPRINANFFVLRVSIPVGPIIVLFKFSVGGSLEVSVGIDICVLSMYAKVWLSMSLSLYCFMFL